MTAASMLYSLYRRLLRRSEERRVAEVATEQRLPRSDLDRLVAARLHDITEHAARHVPFYRERLAAAGLGQHGVGTRAALRRWPVTTRKDLVAAGTTALDEHERPDRLDVRETGGTSGVPMRYWGSRDDLAAAEARNRYVHLSHGWRPRSDTAMVRGLLLLYPSERGLRGRLRRWMTRTRWLDVYRADDQAVTAFLRGLAKRPPEFLTGRPPELEAVARRASALGLAIRIPAAQSFGEVLFDHQRRLLHEAFGCEVFDRYGSRETGTIAMECDAHSGLHVLESDVLVEILRDGKSVPRGERGNVVVTMLRKRAMPFIRYDTGDVAAWAEGPCPCGRTTARLASLLGRTSEILTTRGGRMLNSQLLIIAFLRYADTTEFQVAAFDGTTLRIKVVADAKVRAALPAVERALREVDASLRIAWVEVDAIPRAPSGKRRYVDVAGPQPFALLDNARVAGPSMGAPPATRR